MTLIESTTAAAIEALLRAKNSLDDGAREAIERLDEKCIVIDATGLNLSFRFARGKARVLGNIDPTPDLKISGSISGIFEVMLGKQTDAVSLDGGAMRSAVEGVVNEVARRTTGAANRAEIDQLKSSIEELTSAVEALQKRLKEAEER